MEAIIHTKSAIITQCAWCREVKVGANYRALGLKSLIHEVDMPAENGRIVHFGVSHGICDPCKERMLGYSLAA